MKMHWLSGKEKFQIQRSIQEVILQVFWDIKFPKNWELFWKHFYQNLLYLMNYCGIYINQNYLIDKVQEVPMM